MTNPANRIEIARAHFSNLPAHADHDATIAALERHDMVMRDLQRIVDDAKRTGDTDATRFLLGLMAYEQSRRELLIVSGADPDSEEILPVLLRGSDA
jgi:hypothetical protein